MWCQNSLGISFNSSFRSQAGTGAALEGTFEGVAVQLLQQSTATAKADVVLERKAGALMSTDLHAGLQQSIQKKM